MTNDDQIKVSPEMDDDIADSLGSTLFLIEMSQRLSDKRDEGRHGWHQPGVCSMVELKLMLGAAITAPDPNLVDIANFCMMIWNRRRYEKTLPLQEVRPGLDEGV